MHTSLDFFLVLGIDNRKIGLKKFKTNSNKLFRAQIQDI